MAAAPTQRPPRESVPRLIAKTIEWRITGIILGVVVGYYVTGSWSLGALFGGVYNVVRFGLMPIRDWLWGHVRWGWLPAAREH